MTKIIRKDKAHRGNASQFFVAGELCRRGYVAVITLGNCPNTDILCSDVEGKKFIHVQVKTYRPGDKTCSVGLKAEKNYGSNFFWILGGIPEDGLNNNFEYYVIPSPVMSKQVISDFQCWLETPGKKKLHDKDNKFRCVIFPPHKNRRYDWILEYKNRWDLIEKVLE